MLKNILLAGLTLWGVPDQADDRVVNALRVTAAQGAPTIDGKLDDAIWAVADSVTDFVQMEPSPGAPAKFRTVGRIAFDDQAVYVAMRAYDPEPSKIMAQLTRRDQDSPSDWLFLSLDSRHDRRTAYTFMVNPVGVKRDMIFTNDDQEDDGWNAIWDVEVRVDSLGWSAEFRIPLSQLRFSTEGKGVWGLQLARMVQREREMSSWTPMRQDEPRIVSTFGELHGMTSLPTPRRLELLPYTVSQVKRAPGDPANPFYSASQLRASAGLDLKYGLTSSLTLDATINPDFGQVEADPSQVNLTAFETFFPEQRPFFSEGADIFNFGIALGDGDGANEQLFYSRRIGRAPQGSPNASSGEYSDVPMQTRILGAAKLSGRTQSGWSLGVLNAVTGEERARLGTGFGVGREEVVEPLTNYSMLRLRRDLNQGRTQVGAVATGVVRRLDGTELDWLRTSAFAGGADFSHRFAGNHWEVTGSLLGSQVFGSRDAILRAQHSPARYFQRPDQDYVEVDSATTSLGGWFASYRASKIAGGNWRGGVLGQVRSPGFEVNDMGYQRSADFIVNAAYLGYREIRPGKLFRSYGANANVWSERNFGGDNLGVGGNVNGHAQLINYWNLHGGINRQGSGLDTRALRGGPAIRKPGGYNGWMGTSSDSRKPFTVGGNAFWEVEEESGSRSIGLSMRGSWRMAAATQLSLSPHYSVNRSGWQYVTQRTDAAGARHYVFGELDQRTVGMSARVNHTFTPDLSFQMYVQPFISAGSYDGFKEVASPRAARFAERFRDFPASAVTRDESGYRVRTGADERSVIRFGNPDFTVRDLNLNAVMRWEYRPGSTVFLVWSHGQQGFSGDGSFNLGRDVGELFRERATNVFLIKANWWLSR